MRKGKFTKSQIITTLKQVEGGRQVEDVCRELDISDATYYVWKAKYGGMEAADVQRLRGLETEHGKLKRMYAGRTLACRLQLADPARQSGRANARRVP